MATITLLFYVVLLAVLFPLMLTLKQSVEFLNKGLGFFSD